MTLNDLQRCNGHYLALFTKFIDVELMTSKWLNTDQDTVCDKNVAQEI